MSTDPHGRLSGCRRHGPVCRVPWGYDEAHTDQAYPYSLDQLAARGEGPHRYAYPTSAAYERAWALWRALRRDAGPTRAEADTATRVRMRRAELPAAAVDAFLVGDSAPLADVLVARYLAGGGGGGH